MSAVPKVGDTVWFFDSNIRAYETTSEGRRGGAIYAKHWVEAKIVGETRTSWLLNPFVCGHKIDKATGEFRGSDIGARRRKVAFTRAEVDDDIWANENGHRIRTEVGHCRDIETLRAIEALLARKGAKS